jgi:UDP-2-acetamido-3-amino-2,3-dideoxy-glucuronate N-acetyltransferase
MMVAQTSAPVNAAPYRLIKNVEFGRDVVVHSFTNLYGCTVGAETRIGPFVEIQSGVVVGERCKVQSHSFLCEGITIGDEAFIGHGVVFVNDKRLGAGALVGAGAVVTRDVSSGETVTGVPARAARIRSA